MPLLNFDSRHEDLRKALVHLFAMHTVRHLLLYRYPEQLNDNHNVRLDRDARRYNPYFARPPPGFLMSDPAIKSAPTSIGSFVSTNSP